MSPKIVSKLKTNIKVEKAKDARAPVSTPQNDKTAVRIAGLEESLGYVLRRAQLSYFQAFLFTMRGFDVRPINYAVLVLIRANPGLSQIALSSALGIRKANFVTVLDGLEARGLTERRKTRMDRRAFALYLTPAGDTFARHLEAAHATLEKRIQQRLGERKTQTLRKLLKEFFAAHQTEEDLSDLDVFAHTAKDSPDFLG